MKTDEKEEQGSLLDSLGQKNWTDKLAQEDKDLRERENVILRSKDSMLARVRARVGWRRARELGGRLRDTRLAALLRYLPYGLLLALAPRIQSGVGFFGKEAEEPFLVLPYGLMLAAAVLPVAGMWMWLRPVRGTAWERGAALLLPVELYFYMEYMGRHPLILLLLTLLYLGGLAGIAVAVIKTRPADSEAMKAADAEAIAQGRRAYRRFRRTERRSELAANKDNYRRLLRYGVLWTAALLLAPALLAAAPNLARPRVAGGESLDPKAMTEALPTLAWLSVERWSDLTSEQRQRAVQTLFNLEAENLGFEPFSVTDRAFASARGKPDGHTSLTKLLKLEDPSACVKLVCEYAFHARQRSKVGHIKWDSADSGAFPEESRWRDNLDHYIANPSAEGYHEQPLEKDAEGYAANREAYYAALIRDYWADRINQD